MGLYFPATALQIPAKDILNIPYLKENVAFNVLVSSATSENIPL